MSDLIIIGGGPGGLAAAIYATRYNLKTKIITRDIGGEMAKAAVVENYPGFTKISGIELSKKIENQVKKLGVEIILGEVKNIKQIPQGFEISTDSQDFQAKTVLYTVGTQRKKLGAPGEKKFLGRGVGYCATCDGPLFRNKIVAVAGGGNAGVASAWYLSDIAKKIYLIEIMPKILAEPWWLEKIKAKKNIKIITSTKILEILGDQTVTALKIESHGKQKQLKIEGIFIEIGQVPNTQLAKNLGVKLDQSGYIKTKIGGRTNLKGFYSAGDTTTGSDNFRQIITAMAEGAIASHSIYQDLK